MLEETGTVDVESGTVVIIPYEASKHWTPRNTGELAGFVLWGADAVSVSEKLKTQGATVQLRADGRLYVTSEDLVVLDGLIHDFEKGHSFLAVKIRDNSYDRMIGAKGSFFNVDSEGKYQAFWFKTEFGDGECPVFEDDNSLTVGEDADLEGCHTTVEREFVLEKVTSFVAVDPSKVRMVDSDGWAVTLEPGKYQCILVHRKDFEQVVGAGIRPCVDPNSVDT